MSVCRWIVACLVLFALPLFLPCEAKPIPPGIHYRVTDLGMLPGCDVIEPRGINHRGQVVGYCYQHVPPGHGNSESAHAFLWESGQMKGLPTLGGPYSHAYAINDRGDVVGDADTTDKKTLPVVWRNTEEARPVPLSEDEGLATAINHRGDVLIDTGQLLVWSKGHQQALDTPPELHHRVVGISAGGDVAGCSFTRKVFFGGVPRDETNQALRWRAGKPEKLATLGGVESDAKAINETGWIAGWSINKTGECAACLWKNHMPQPLPGVTGNWSQANAINSAGDCVGAAKNALGHAGPCLWRQGRLTELNSAIPSDSGWDVFLPDGINDRGQIVGIGRHDGKNAGYLLTPER